MRKLNWTCFKPELPTSFLNFPQNPYMSCEIVYVNWNKLCPSVCFWHYSPQWARASSLSRILDHTQRCTTFGRTPLGEWSARRTDLYLTTHNTHIRQTSMSLVGFEPTISAGERPQTYALNSAATGTGKLCPSASFLILSNSVFTNFPIIQRYSASAFKQTINKE